MKWKFKSHLQRCCSVIPGGGAIYNQLQRRLGGLRQPDYMNKFSCQKQMAILLKKHGTRINGAEVFEVGTGWIPLVPIGFWLCGAARVRTCDLNHYLELPLLRGALHWISGHTEPLVEHYAPLVSKDSLRARLSLLSMLKDQPENFLREAKIEYMAPADAARTGLPAESVDIHFSANSFEHIPQQVLAGILREARRVLKPDGLAMHHVDPSDHFSHCDPSITSINFLQFEPHDWQKFNDNRYAYHNRLRDADYRRLFEASGLGLIESSYEVDGRALQALKDGFPLAAQFSSMPPEELCRYRLDYVACRGVAQESATANFQMSHTGRRLASS